MTEPPVPRLPVEPVRPGAATAATPASGPDAVVLRGGFSLGAPFGIPVRISVSSLLVYLLLAASTLGQDTLDAGGSQTARWAITVTCAIALEGSVFLHELGHCVIARALGLRVTGLRLWLLGGISQVESERTRPRVEYAIAVVGPMISLVLGGLFGASGLLLHGYAIAPRGAHLVGAALLWVGVVNAVLAAYNLIPGLPFDGGRVLRAGVWALSGRPNLGTRVAAIAGFVAAGLTALATLTLTGDTTTSSGAALLLPGLLVSGYVGSSAYQALRSARLLERAPAISAGAMCRRALVALADLPLGEAMRRAAAHGATAIIAISSDGRPQALMSGQQADAVPAERRPWIPLSTVCRPITDGLVLDARLAGEAVLDAMRRHPAGEYLVVEPSGQLLGVLAAIDVAAALEGA